MHYFENTVDEIIATSFVNRRRYYLLGNQNIYLKIGLYVWAMRVKPQCSSEAVNLIPQPLARGVQNSPKGYYIIPFLTVIFSLFSLRVLSTQQSNSLTFSCIISMKNRRYLCTYSINGAMHPI